MRIEKLLLSAAAASFLCGGTALGASSPSAAVEAAVANYARPPIDRAQDAARKPDQVLAFAGIRPGDVVADLVPEHGYYTRILSKLVGPQGKVYAYVPIPGYPAVRAQLEKAGKPVPIDWALAIQDIRNEYPNVVAVWEQLYAFGGSFGLPQQVNAVLTADHYHDLHQPGYAVPEKGPNGAPAKPLDMVGTNKAIFRAMKPGGLYVIVDREGAKGSGFTATSADPDAVKSEVLAAGFAMDGQSDALAGEHDFILRFKKPDNASAATKRPANPNTGMQSFFGNTSHSGINRKVQRWVFYHPNGTFQEYGNTGTRVQQGTWFWDADGNNCMLKSFPMRERGSVICHDYRDKVNQPVGTPIGKGAQAWEIQKGYHYPAPPASYAED